MSGLSSDDSSGSDVESWISWFCSLSGNEFFCPIDENYISDNFNLYGLKATIPDYSHALQTILDETPPRNCEDDDEERLETLTANTQILYGMIHARFIVTNRGLDIMAQKYNRGDFGTCPRALCENYRVVPIGLFDDFGCQTVRVYCPSCRDVYLPEGRERLRNAIDLPVDGAFFGSTFAHLFFMTYPSYLPNTHTYEIPYIPKIFGYVVKQQRALLRSELPSKNSKPIIYSNNVTNPFDNMKLSSDTTSGKKKPTTTTHTNSSVNPQRKRKSSGNAE